tara:strand:- start:233 stop:496 length:264 start_codon:yes stop_codon:yes gene_type:complete
MKINPKKYFKELKRIDSHKDYLWNRIWDLRQEITRYVLININNDTYHMDKVNHWEALRFKAKLIKKYSQKLRRFDTIRWNEDVPERI